MDRDSRLGVLDLACLVGIVLLAIATRLPGLELRGQWDADQGNEMLVLLAMVRDGEIPLLGPATFAGTFHHGALYYYLLAPAAFLSDASPHAAVLTIALLGIGTVVAVWWLGVAVGGRWTGIVAGLLMAVSPAAVLGSTFIWNPNLVPLGSALGVTGAVLAWRRESARWWLLAAAGTMLAMQLHVSGGILLPPLAFAWVLDLARRPAGERGPVLGAGLAGLGIIALGYVPLLAHELGSGFSDTQGLVGYLQGGAGGGGAEILTRLWVVAFRSIAWPVVGVITEAPMAAAGVTILVVGLTIVAFRTASSAERPSLLLLLGIVAWSVPVLALTAPTLLTAVPGLPNDHYHTFLDPIVVVLAATGIAGAAGHLRRAPDPWSSGGRRSSHAMRRLLGGVAIVSLVAISAWRWPAATAPDGGWPLADAAAVRLLAGDGVETLTIVSLPEVKTPDAIRFPLERRNVVPLAPVPGQDPTGGVILVCDPLFEEIIGAACGGPAELSYASEHGIGQRPDDSFAAGDRRTITVMPAR